MASKKYDEYYKKARKELEARLEADKRNLVAEKEAAENLAKKTALGSIKKAEEAASAGYKKSSVAKLLNERKLSERLANLGLSDSGYADSAKLGLEIEKQRSDSDTAKTAADAVSNANNRFEEKKDELNTKYAKEVEKLEEAADKSAASTAEKQVKADEQRKAEEQAAIEKAAREKEKAAATKLKSDRSDDFDLLKLKIKGKKNSDKVYTNSELAGVFGLIKEFGEKYSGTEYALTELELETLCQILGFTADDYRSFYDRYKPVKTAIKAPENNLEFFWGIPGTNSYRSSRGNNDYGL